MIQFHTPIAFDFEPVPSEFEFTLSLVDDSLSERFVIGKLRGRWEQSTDWLSCRICGKLWGHLDCKQVSGRPPAYKRYGIHNALCPFHATNGIDMLGLGIWSYLFAADRSVLEFLILNTKEDFEYDPRKD